jgi:hypothetical protein
MGKTALGLLALLVALTFGAGANAAIYTGSLTFTPPPGDDPLFTNGGTGGVGDPVATRGWRGGAASVSWEVTDEDPNQPGFAWRYTYTVSAFSKAIAKVLLETSPSFTEAEITAVTGRSLAGDSPTTYSGNPGQPDSLYGLTFEGGPASSAWTFSFFSNRSPVWGDIYALGSPTGAVDNYLHNLGFTAADADPTHRGPGEGTAANFYFNHVLVPDTDADPGPVIPEPSVMVGLLGMSVMGLGAVLWRRKRTV